MPLGVSLYDTAKLQRRLWTPRANVGQDLLAWLECSDLSSVSGVSGAVTQLRDLGPRGTSFTPLSTGPDLVFDTLGMWDASGSYPGSSSRRNLRGTLSASYTGTTLHAYVVATLSGAGDSSGRLVSCATSGQYDWDKSTAFALDRAGIGSAIRIERNFASPASASVTTDTPFIAEAIFDGTNMWVAVNGTDASASAQSSAFNFNLISIGQSVAASGEAHGGLIAAAIIDVAAYSARRRALFQGYLAWKWGLAANLPASHPFKNRPPLIGG